MRPIIPILACLLSFWLLPSGTLRAQIQPMVSEGATRAVIIGISDYEDPRITDLRFADRDAEAFAEYLRSRAGGAVPAENIRLLTNNQATQGEMSSALTWLWQQSQPNDRAIIYFAGHGDMETMLQQGFLLTYNASATTYTAGGAFAVDWLQRIVGQLAEKQVSTILVTDACHAGKLAGSAIGGTTATAQALISQLRNGIKILSCQPDELSLESESWGGGRGLFSFYLIDGLTGLADGNNDGKVTLLELERFLQDEVSRVAQPHPQLPKAEGPPQSEMARVDAEALAALERRQLNAHQGVAAARPRSSFTATTDTLVPELLRQFDAALAADHLLYPEVGSAYAILHTLEQYPEAREQTGLLRLNLSAALQDEAQTAINDYLRSDLRELRRRWNLEKRYDHYPTYLEKAAELLGPQNFSYDNLLARANYFAGLNLRLRALTESADSLYGKALARQEAAVAIDSNAAYAFNEIGLIYFLEGDHEKAMSNFYKATALSPAWALPWSNLTLLYIHQRNFQEAERAGRRALAFDSTFAWAHENLGLNYERQERWTDAARHYRHALAVDSTSFGLRGELAKVLVKMDSLAAGIQLLEEYIRMQPQDAAGFNELGYLLRIGGKPEQAEPYLRQAQKMAPDFSAPYFNLGMILYSQQRFAEAEKAWYRYSALEPGNGSGLYNLACCQALLGKKEAALENLEKAMRAGYNNMQQIRADTDLTGLREDPRFETMLHKYGGR